ncbi:MAG TPA: hypothetical protein VGT24_01570 [Candidatus Acidoferrales bacterium]|nr:hypothetical protein [Candidatus Acidoferrales bacterium]
MRFEIVRFPTMPDSEGWFNGFVVAVDGIRSIEFSVHKRDLDKFRTPEQLESFLRSEGQKYIGMFGDGRNPRPIAEEPSVLPYGPH